MRYRTSHYTRRLTRTVVVIECATCGNDFEMPESVHRQRMKLSATGNLYCSIPCLADKLREREFEKKKAKHGNA